MPLDLGAKGSCQIGGNISTNAGGLRFLRYRSMHANVLGLEAVLADGTILTNMRALRKDNTGYDLKQLFIGSEGTLGVVTAAAIQLAVCPNAVNVMLLACSSFEDVLSILRAARAGLGEILSACEFFDAESMACVLRHSKKDPPLKTSAPFYGWMKSVALTHIPVLIETHGSNGDHDREKVESLLTKLAEKGLVVDGTVAQDQKQADALWHIRESIPVLVKKDGTVFKYDLSLPPAAFYRVITHVRERLKGLQSICVGYGHVGDGNVHLNVASHEPSHLVLPRIEPFVYEFTEEAGGSVSAEHGIGLLKTAYLSCSKSEPEIQLMRSLKRHLDGRGILNPYKVL
jgi:FAD/FMN-containing dehydrogenase